MDDPIYYCKIVTSIQNTINIQNQIDAICEDVEKEVIAV